MLRFQFALIGFLACQIVTADQPETVHLTISPQAIDGDVLRYQLMPRESELKRGNAASIILRLPWDQVPFMTQVYPKLWDWSDKPLHDPAWDEPEPDGPSTRGLPERFFNDLKRAAYRSECDWDYGIGEIQPPHFTLLPDVQGLRGFFAGLSAEVRNRIARRDFAEAREAILVGLAVSRHLSRTPFLIIQFNAVTNQQLMLNRTAEMMGEPESPNLYWALAMLPKDLLHVDRAADLESSMLTMALPAIRELDRPREADEWNRLCAQLLELMETVDALPKTTLLEKLARHQKFLNAAQDELPKLMNKSPQDIAAMSDSEAVVRLLVLVQTQFDNRASVAYRLPPREAWPELKKLTEDVKGISAKTGLLGELASESQLTSPVLNYARLGRSQRKIQMLRVIEAVRDFAAHHEGRLPKSLAEVRAVPVPFDPLTDQAFEWIVKGDTATLAPPPTPMKITNQELERSVNVHYVLTVRRETKPANADR